MEEVFEVQSCCGSCGRPGATGSWSICPDCRASLSDRQVQRFASMAPGSCVACQEPMPGKRTAGRVYCPRCRRRYHKQ